MISAWKKLINKNDSSKIVSDISANNNGFPPGIQKLDKQLQRRFAHGVNYNLKVVIKGDARVGKTALFRRLEGHEFDDDYLPTENLTVTSINWNYKTTDDIVKIDLWEAIDPIWRKNNNLVDLKSEHTNDGPIKENGNNQNNDKAQMKQATNSNNYKNPIPESARQSLVQLSENLDVYNRTDAVLLVLDMTKLWTFKYIQAELHKIPRHIPVLVIANHRDQGHHRTVSGEQVKTFIDSIKRDPGDALIMYTEASMKNGFGLNLIRKFFSIPYLKLQEISLLKQLELNRCDFMSTLEELDLMQSSVDQEYDRYLELKTIMRRQRADAMSPINSGYKQLDEDTRDKIRNTTMSSEDLDKDLSAVKSLSSDEVNDKRSIAKPQTNQNLPSTRTPSIVIGAKCSLPETKAIHISKLTSTSRDEVESPGSKDKNPGGSDESEDEEVPRANPLVAGYQSDLDSDDQVSVNKDS